MTYFILRGEVGTTPRVITEYTANIEVDARIPGLMHVLDDMLTGYANVFPIDSVHMRALYLDQYRMADGTEDDAFIYVTLRIKAGRRKVVTGPIYTAVFAAMRAHLADVFACRYLRLTLELVGFDAHGFHVGNGVHACFARTAKPQ